MRTISSAHSADIKQYNLRPRHARLAIHSIRLSIYIGKFKD
jgi:hypothetical protein